MTANKCKFKDNELSGLKMLKELYIENVAKCDKAQMILDNGNRKIILK